MRSLHWLISVTVISLYTYWSPKTSLNIKLSLLRCTTHFSCNAVVDSSCHVLTMLSYQVSAHQGIAVQETQWDPPSEGFLPAPAEWLAYAHQQASLAQAASSQEHATHTMQAAASLLPSSSGLEDNSLNNSSPENTRLGSATERLDDPVQQQKSSPESKHLESAAQLMHAALQQPDISDAECIQHHLAAGEVSHRFNSQDPARPESSGLMAEIPAPEGTHIRFADSDEETADASSHSQVPLHSQLDTEAHNASQSFPTASPQPSADSNHTSDRLAADKHSLVQTAVDGMLASTVVTSDFSEQTVPAVPLNNLGLPASPQQISSHQDMPAVDTTDMTGPTSRVGHIAQSVAASSSSTLATEQALPDELGGEAAGNDTALQPKSSDDSQHHIIGAQGDAAEPDSSQHQVTDQLNRDQHDTAGAKGDMAQSDSSQHSKVAEQGNSSQRDMAGAEDDIAEANGVGITYASLGGALQSKKALPRRLWKYWLQRYSLFSRCSSLSVC